MSKPLKKPASERSKVKGPPADSEAREGGEPRVERGAAKDEPKSASIRSGLGPGGPFQGADSIEDWVLGAPPPGHVAPPSPGLAESAAHWSMGKYTPDPSPDDPPASTTRKGYEGYEQGEATEREPTDIPMPPEWKGTESQWEALSPQKKEQFVADTQEAHRASQMYVPPKERR